MVSALGAKKRERDSGGNRDWVKSRSQLGSGAEISAVIEKQAGSGCELLQQRQEKREREGERLMTLFPRLGRRRRREQKRKTRK